MGCINSTSSNKKINELNSGEKLRVRVIRLQPESPSSIRGGFLELTSRELIFTANGRRDPVTWALQHLRRYGLNEDVFSFEAGRRCMTGPGIYTFRIAQQADKLFQLFQRYVNAVSLVTDEAFTYPDQEHPSHTLGRPDPKPNTNNYLEPVPIVGINTAIVMPTTTQRESYSSSPLSLELDSPDSVPSLSFTNNEVVQFQQPTTPGSASTYANSNVYLEHPLRSSQLEHNNNSSAGCSSTAGPNGASSSAYSTLTRKAVIKRSSLDVPPEECAPMLLASADHMYANVEGLGSRLDNVERCYENLSRLEMSLLLQSTPAVSSAAQRNDVREPTTPDALTYIVLDLDQPRSPAQCSPKSLFGQLTIPELTNADISITLPTASTILSMPSTTKQLQQQQPDEMVTLSSNSVSSSAQQQLKAESSLGYSTIDFIKTGALIKSSTHGADFDHDHEESRITRHSKCVRKAYSISE